MEIHNEALAWDPTDITHWETRVRPILQHMAFGLKHIDDKIIRGRYKISSKLHKSSMSFMSLMEIQGVIDTLVFRNNPDSEDCNRMIHICYPLISEANPPEWIQMHLDVWSKMDDPTCFADVIRNLHTKTHLLKCIIVDNPQVLDPDNKNPINTKKRLNKELDRFTKRMERFSNAYNASTVKDLYRQFQNQKCT